MKATDIATPQQALDFVEGVINDFEGGVSTKSETLAALYSYTAQIIALTKHMKP